MTERDIEELEFQHKLTALEPCPLNVCCSSYGDPYIMYDSSGEYVQVEEHDALVEFLLEEIALLRLTVKVLEKDVERYKFQSVSDWEPMGKFSGDY